MLILKTIESVREFQNNSIFNNKEKKVAIVTTMGNLHKGHLSLVKKAKNHADIVIVSIFVNPLQFAKNEDLDTYPNTLLEDLDKLSKINVDAVFTPSTAEIYPEGKNNTAKIIVSQYEKILCALSRPDFFSGVATVVSALFNIVKPDIAVFGEKDFQQLLVVKKFVKDLHYNIEILPEKIIREESGLAMSSRNNYFSTSQKEQASMIYKELVMLRNNIINKNIPISKAIKTSKEKLSKNSFKIEYLEIRTEESLKLIDENKDLNNAARIFIAAIFHGVRLIDNIKL